MKNYKPSFLILGIFFSATLWSCIDDAVVDNKSGKSFLKTISTFDFEAVPSLNFETTAVFGDVNEETRKVTLTVPNGVDVTKLVPTIIISDKATVSPASGVAQDFSASVNYVLTSEDGTRKAYVVTVKVRDEIDFQVSLPSDANVYPGIDLVIPGSSFGDPAYDKAVLTNNVTVLNYDLVLFSGSDSELVFKVPGDLPLGSYTLTVYVGNQSKAQSITVAKP